MKIFISISSYDAILDASIASILCKKKLIDHEVYTSLSYSKKDLVISEYKKYFDQISFVDAKEVLVNGSFENFEIPIRQFYSIYENLKNAVDASFDYMLILNSGSWLFDGNLVNKIIAKLQDFTIGCRAMKYSNMKRLSCDDHFVFINIKNLKKKNILQNDFDSFLPFDFKYGGIHTLLNNFFNKLNYNDTVIYSDITESVNIYNKFPKYLLPLNFDKNFKLLHSNKREKKVEALRYCYLNFYAKDYFDEFLMSQINTWKTNLNLVQSENGSFYFKESLYQKLKNILCQIYQRKDYGILEKIL